MLSHINIYRINVVYVLLLRTLYHCTFPWIACVHRSLCSPGRLPSFPVELAYQITVWREVKQGHRDSMQAGVEWISVTFFILTAWRPQDKSQQESSDVMKLGSFGSWLFFSCLWRELGVLALLSLNLYGKLKFILIGLVPKKKSFVHLSEFLNACDRFRFY